MQLIVQGLSMIGNLVRGHLLPIRRVCVAGSTYQTRHLTEASSSAATVPRRAMLYLPASSEKMLKKAREIKVRNVG